MNGDGVISVKVLLSATSSANGKTPGEQEPRLGIVRVGPLPQLSTRHFASGDRGAEAWHHLRISIVTF